MIEILKGSFLNKQNNTNGPERSGLFIFFYGVIMANTKKKLVICDIDNVVVIPDPKWIAEAFKKKVIFNRVSNWAIIHAACGGRESFEKAVMDRLVYDLPEWLGLPDIARETFLNAYKDNETFYQGLPLTKFGSELVLRNQGHKIVFVTHVLGGKSDVSKREWIFNNFKNTDFTYEAIDISEPKSKIISTMYGDFDVFVDDYPANHLDVMEKCGNEKKEFIFPSYGYNQGLILAAKNLAEEKKFTLNTY